MALEILAHAKVNLGLEVLGRRPDGYHEVVTILQEIDLADTIEFVEAAELSLQSNRAGLADDPENLILRAARLLRAATGVRAGARIHLDKKIPLAAGLGGGSSDAAATLRALNRLWGLDWDEARLAEIARQIGTDVAFFLRGGTQLATGRGDELRPLPTPSIWPVLVPVSASGEQKTRQLYASLRPEDWSNGRRVRGFAASLVAGQLPPMATLPSGFERVTRRAFLATAEAFDAVKQAGGIPALCGAGPSILSLPSSPEEANRIAARLRDAGLPALVCRALTTSGRLPDP